MVKVPKYKKIDGQRRELGNAEKGMIIAFFVIYGAISTVSSLVGPPWSTVKSFLERYYKRGTMDNLSRLEKLAEVFPFCWEKIPPQVV